MALKVEFLVKQELQYELIVRGIEFDSNDSVSELRKLLRAAIKINVMPNPYNLSKRLVVVDEIQTLTNSLQSLENKIQDLEESKDINGFIRAEIKINHYGSRVNNLSQFKLGVDEKTKVEGLIVKLKTVKESFDKLKFDANEKATVERKLSESILEEEELENVFTEKLKCIEKVSQSNLNVQEDQKCSFAKLPNPIQIHLRNFHVCDGLDVNKLLGFISNILKLKDETELTDDQVIDLSLGYSTGPLHIKLLEFKRSKVSLNVLHQGLLSYFIPL